MFWLETRGGTGFQCSHKHTQTHKLTHTNLHGTHTFPNCSSLTVAIWNACMKAMALFLKHWKVAFEQGRSSLSGTKSELWCSRQKKPMQNKSMASDHEYIAMMEQPIRFSFTPQCVGLALACLWLGLCLPFSLHWLGFCFAAWALPLLCLGFVFAWKSMGIKKTIQTP